ncbi:MAG: MFS transporter [Thermoguttaceae bacterium]|jgi:MFS family permease
MPTTDPYAAWRLRNYRFYAGSWFLMTIAKQIETVAIGVYIIYGLNYAAKEGALALGFLGLVQALPVMVLAIPGGQIADRLDRRLVVAATLAVTMLVSVALAVACYFHCPATWIYSLLLLSAVAQAFGSPSRSALLPWIVPAEGFSNAVAWNSSVFHIASMVGPALGGALVELPHGVPLALLVVVASRLLAWAGMLLLPAARHRPSQPSISVESLMAGVRFVWNQTPILATITLDLFAVLLGGADYLLPVFAKDILHFGPSAVGYLRSAEAAGAIFMAIVLTHTRPIARAGRAMLWAVAGFGVATIVFGLSKNFYLSLAAMFWVGALDNISVVVRHTLVQMLTPDAMRGRVSAVNNVFIVASNDLGGLESGLTAWLLNSAVLSVVGGGIGTILVVLGAAWKWPQILALGSLGDLRPIDCDQSQAETVRELS